MQAGSKIYANRQKAKMAMSEAQLLHAEKKARGEKLTKANYWKQGNRTGRTKRSLIILSTPVASFAWAVLSDDPAAMEKVKLFFEMFSHYRHGLQTCGSLSWRVFMVSRAHRYLGTEEKNNGKP